MLLTNVSHQLGGIFGPGRETRNVHTEENETRTYQNEAESSHSTKIDMPIQDKAFFLFRMTEVHRCSERCDYK